MMTDAVIGKTKEEALELVEIFSKNGSRRKSPEQKSLGEASLLAGVSKFPQHCIKCSTLAWNALKKSIERSEETS